MRKRSRKRSRSSSPIILLLLLVTVATLTAAMIKPVAAQTVILTPTQGTQGTLIQVSGSGFNPAATLFVVTCGSDSPGAHLSVDCEPSAMGHGNTTICINTGSGNCVGTFRVDEDTVGGVYVVGVSVLPPNGQISTTSAVTTTTTVAGGTSTIITTITTCDTSCGPAFAQFVVGSPSAQINLSPTVGEAGTTVVVSGNGYSVQDTSCTISTGTASIDTELFATTPPCSISAGNAGGSFQVKAGAPPGLYLISLYGMYGAGTKDFASAYFEVPSLTTTTTSPTTVTTSTSTTSLSFTTTVNATSTSISTTSVSSTGATTETSSALSTQTFLAGSTSTTTVTTSTTYTVSLASVILTTTTLFVTSTIGGIIAPLWDSGSADLVNLLGLVAVLGLLGPILFRRFLL